MVFTFQIGRVCFRSGSVGVTLRLDQYVKQISFNLLAVYSHGAVYTQVNNAVLGLFQNVPYAMPKNAYEKMQSAAGEIARAVSKARKDYLIISHRRRAERG